MRPSVTWPRSAKRLPAANPRAQAARPRCGPRLGRRWRLRRGARAAEPRPSGGPQRQQRQAPSEEAEKRAWSAACAATRRAGKMGGLWGNPAPRHIPPERERGVRRARHGPGKVQDARERPRNALPGQSEPQESARVGLVSAEPGLVSARSKLASSSLGCTRPCMDSMRPFLGMP